MLGKKITQKQLNEALDLQKQYRTNNPGKHAPLVGEILVERGYIEKAVVDRSVTELIVSLKNALELSNATLEERVKERTRELEFALSKITVLNAHKTEFVSNISHELKTPLTHIMGYTDLFIDNAFGELDEDQLEAFNAIKGATDRLDKLIVDLVSFTEIEQGEMILQRNLALPFEICQSAMNSCLSSAKEKQINLLMQCKENLPRIYIDTERILWVLRQIISNAIKFTPSGGYVLIKARAINNSIQFAIIDTGIGIPKGRKEEIFEAFVQLDGSSTRNAGGTGIGLTICKEIIEAHESEIQVKSEVNKGAEFSFSIILPDEEVN